MKKIITILGLAAIMSATSSVSSNATNNGLTKKCRIKKTGDNKWKVKGDRCNRLVKGKLNDDFYYYYY